VGIHLFIIRGWYFLALAMVGTLHISIPLAIGTYYATRDREPLTMLMFVPVFFLAIAYLNVNAMRAVIRSYGLTGEPELMNMIKAVIRHVTLDTMLPLMVSFLLAAILVFGLRLAAGPDYLLAGVFDPASASELSHLVGLLQGESGIDAALLANVLTVMPYIYVVVLCVFGVSIASGAASGSAQPPGHLPIHGLGSKFWHIVAALAVNLTLVGTLAAGAGLGAVWGTLHGIQIIPAIGFGVMGLLLMLGYFNAYVVFALAYCAHEEERREEREIISHVRRYGLQDEGLDVRAMRHARGRGKVQPQG
jgi:hypothetical protein